MIQLFGVLLSTFLNREMIMMKMTKDFGPGGTFDIYLSGLKMFSQQMGNWK